MKRTIGMGFVIAVAITLLLRQPARAQQGRFDARGDDVRAVLRTVALMYQFDPDLIDAIATVESSHNPSAVSPAGAQGLMQLMPATAREFRVSDPFDPVDNALGAARFLDYLRRWNGSRGDSAMRLPDLIAAYNAGPAAIEKYRGVPPYSETREYVRRVLWTYLLDTPPRAAPGNHQAARASAQPSRATRLGGDQVVLDRLAKIKRSRTLASGMEVGGAGRGALQ
jgi:hypothetical protein